MKTYLVKYSGELGTKATRTRWGFIRTLARNLRRSLKAGGVTAELQAGWDQISVIADSNCQDILARIPGVQSFSEVEVVEFEAMDKFLEEAASFFRPHLPGHTFAVRCRKAEKSFGISRMELERELGALLVDIAGVDLDNPGITCYVELRQGKGYLYHDRMRGMGGLPAGSLGKALTLISGGIDSPVAAWNACRMGMDQHFLYFDLGGETQADIAAQTVRYLYGNWMAGSRSKFIIADFKPVIREILKTDSRYHNLILKYCFYSSAEMVARRLYCDALVTGEALGQVSTQTLKNLAALDKVTGMLIIRPLSTLPKQDIMEQARRIGTYDMSYKGKEYCAINPRNVVTAATYEKLMEALERFDRSVVEKAVQDCRTIDLWRDTYTAAPKHEIPGGAVVIDLRSEQEFNTWSLGGSRNIPFQRAWQEYPHWDMEDSYFLVCAEGSRSAMLKEYMQRDGYKVKHLPGGVNKMVEEVKR